MTQPSKAWTLVYAWRLMRSGFFAELVCLSMFLVAPSSSLSPTMSHMPATTNDGNLSPALSGINIRGLVAVAVASMATNILLFAIPLYSLQIYDRVIVSRSSETLLYLSLIVVLALLATAALDAVRGRLLLRIGNGYVMTLGPRLFNACVAQSARLSQPASQAFRDMNTVRAFIISPQGLAALFDAPLVPIFLLAVYLMHSGLGHAMLFGAAFLLLLALVTEHLTRRALKDASEASIVAQNRIDGIMQNAEAVEAMGMRTAMRAYWNDVQGEAAAAASYASDRNSAVSALAKLVRMLLSLMMLGLGAWYMIHDEITIGAMVAASILAARGLAPLEALIGAWKGLVGARLALERMTEALVRFPRPENSTQIPQPTGQLSVERLAYRPPGSDEPTIKGISFSLQAGTCLGLIGPSAAGKSTLAKLIGGVWQPLSGNVRLDGADVFTWNRDDFGRHCGYLPQDVELFAGTVRDNIARFRDATEVGDELVVLAAKMAGVHELVLRLPKGYDTPIGPGGSSLSAGQRQRIGLARAMLGSPRLLVLDEPNSNLDAEGEAALMMAIKAAKSAGATIVMVSHRPSLLIAADKIAVLVDGQLQQFAPRDEVLKKMLAPVSAQVPASREANTLA